MGGFSLKDLNPRWARWPAPPSVYEIWEDWDGETISGQWTGTAIASGTGVLTVDETGGVVQLANNASDDNSGYQLQRNMETCSLQTGKYTRFMSRLLLSDATSSSFGAGLFITDTTIQHATVDTVAGGLTITDGVGWLKPDAEVNAYGFVMRDSVLSVTGPLVALANSVYKVLGFEAQMSSIAGKGNVIFTADGVEVGSLNSLSMPYSTEEILAPSLAWKSTAGAAKTCKCDYLGVLQQR